jgi:pyruvate dehydrogenase (quinone)
MMLKKNVLDYLVETLVEAGVKHIYAITGDSLDLVNDAVRKRRKALEHL